MEKALESHGTSEACGFFSFVNLFVFTSNIFNVVPKVERYVVVGYLTCKHSLKDYRHNKHLLQFCIIHKHLQSTKI